MARANLKVDENLFAEWTQTFNKHEPTVRYVQVQIEDETLKYVKSGEKQTTAANDLETMVVDELLNDRESCFILFALDEEDSFKYVRWVLIAYIPLGTPVRDKMLYSSSRDDLKRALGSSAFVGNFCADCRKDVTYEEILRCLSTSNNAADGLLTQLEKLAIEERVLEKDSSIRSTAMGVIPFRLDPQAQTALTNLVSSSTSASNNEEAENWLELSLDLEHESIQLNKASKVALDSGASTALIGLIPQTEARYFIIHKKGGGEGATSPSSSSVVYYIFSCPDEAPIKAKMTYAIAKATLLNEASLLGMIFYKTQEIRQPIEIVEALGLEQNGNDGITTALGVGEIQHTLSHAKPTRPGKGRSRIIRKEST